MRQAGYRVRVRVRVRVYPDIRYGAARVQLVGCSGTGCSRKYSEREKEMSSTAGKVSERMLY